MFKMNMEKNIPQSETNFSISHFSKDELTEKQNLIIPLVFTVTARERERESNRHF